MTYCALVCKDLWAITGIAKAMLLGPRVYPSNIFYDLFSFSVVLNYSFRNK